MYFIMASRNELIGLIPQKAVWTEVGVYRGDFSQKILEVCDPSEFTLIDTWAYIPDMHSPYPDISENYAAFSGKIHYEHFGINPSTTQDDNFRYVINRFEGDNRVKIVREESYKAIMNSPDNYFDVMYIDANHRYEYVLRDMMEARLKLKSGGIMLLNDFYEGPGGFEQNMGVMSAANTFVKRYDYSYLAMTHGPYADAALTDDPSSPFVKQFLTNFLDSDLTFIGINDAVVANTRYRHFKKTNGDLRYVAML